MYVRWRARRAAGVMAGAAAARAVRRRRPAHLRLRAARLLAHRLPRARRRRLLRRPHLRPHILRHDHAQPHVVYRRRYYTGERFLILMLA